MKSSRFSERGQALVVIALAAVVLFGFTALAIDGSAKFSDRRHAQNAADTASVAAALAKVDAQVNGLSDTPTTCPPSSGSPSAVCSALQLAGLNMASNNGYSSDVTNNTVSVYSPPISGYYSGNTDYVQVIITSHVKTYFMKVLGIQQSDNIVQAVSLAKKSGSLFSGASIVSLDPSPNCGNGSFQVQGNGNINLNGGGIFVNSNASCGYTQSSCSVTLAINGGGISSAGSSVDTHCSGSSVSTSTTGTQIVVPDEVYMPDKPSACSSGYSSYTSGGKLHFTAGYYPAFPPSGTPNGKDIVLDSGIYCIGSSISWSGNDFASLTGSNVTLYIKSGNSFGININNNITLSATTTSTSVYKGYLIILDGTSSTHPNCTVNGGSNIVLTGTIFAPYCNLTINGGNSSNAPFNAQVIAYDVKLNGSNTITFTYDPGSNAKNPRRVGLMK